MAIRERGDDAGDPAAGVPEPAPPTAPTAPPEVVADVLRPGLLLTPARPANAFEETVQRLLQSIRLGLIGPGEQLPPERELAGMLEVSRDTLREAIASLGEAGWIVSRRGRYGGTFVSDELPSTSSSAPGAGGDPATRAIRLEDTLALRAVIEVGAARRAAESELAATDRERLWQAYEECRVATSAQYRMADSRLHLLIAEVLGAPSVIPLVADVRMRVNELLDGIPLLAPNIAHSDEQHRAIVGAILRGSPDEAASAMAEHLEGTEALLRGFFA
ncbi:FadR/GntR family transcriptional regulator [Agromyces albus]|uniref:FadR/GntR family transcriptional regulator n=1 Tax=Agromyces albus TaxID=205332 RepID=UPI002787FB98|nr:GntR family transcriptional regulator [Agromyces albus]MDQ0574895.1 DNA-binding FadR family transcriptional regulator [Agromyces albus]